MVLAQLESALSKINHLQESDKIKESIQKLKDQIDPKDPNESYPNEPDVDQIKQATQAITYANLINAMYSVPEDSVILYCKPNLFLPDKKKEGGHEKCEPENFEEMVQNVVKVTGRSIITDGVFYQKNKKPIKLKDPTTGSELNWTIENKDHINSIATALKEVSLDKLVIVINGAVHQMALGGIKDWNPTVGGNFAFEAGKTKLGFEESMRKIFNQLRLPFLNRDVKITAKLPDGKERQIGFAVYCDRQKEKNQVQSSSYLKEELSGEPHHEPKKEVQFANVNEPLPGTGTGTGTGKGSDTNEGETTSGGGLSVDAIYSGSVPQAVVEQRNVYNKTGNTDEPVIEDGPGPSPTCSFCQSLLDIFKCCNK